MYVVIVFIRKYANICIKHALQNEWQKLTRKKMLAKITKGWEGEWLNDHNNCKDTEPVYCSFYVLTCITSFHYLYIPCNAFIACYSYMLRDM